MNPATVAGVAGRTSMPPTTDGTGWSRNRNRVDDAEVAAAAADRPEEVGMRVGVDAAISPSAVTISAASRESMVRPYLRTR